MALKGFIYEYGDLITSLKIFDKKLFFIENDKIKFRKGNNETVVCTDFPGKYVISNFITGSGGLWVVYNPIKGSEEKPFVEFISMLGEIKSFHGFDEKLSLKTFLNSKGIYLTFEEKTYRTSLCKVALNEFDRFEPASIKIEISALVIDNRIIFTRTIDGEVNCVDEDLNIIWTKTFDKFVRHRGNLDPMMIDDSVILNLGVDKQSERNCEIISLYKANGEIKWRKAFKKEISNCLLINQKLLVAHEGRLIVLDPGTGEVLVDEPSGFEKRTHEDTLWADEGCLYYISCAEATIRIFSQDGKDVMQDLKIPLPFAPVVGEAFVAFEEGYYLPLALGDDCLQGAVYGLLKLSPAKEGQKPEITVEPRPAYQVLTEETDDGQIYCRIVFKNKDLETILKYGPIVMKEYANVRGAQVWSDERRNPKFNGRIVFSTNLEDFGAEDQQKIQQMIEDTETWFETMSVRAGNRKDKIATELVSTAGETGEA